MQSNQTAGNQPINPETLLSNFYENCLKPKDKKNFNNLEKLQSMDDPAAVALINKLASNILLVGPDKMPDNLEQLTQSVLVKKKPSLIARLMNGIAQLFRKSRKEEQHLDNAIKVLQRLTKEVYKPESRQLIILEKILQKIIEKANSTKSAEPQKQRNEIKQITWKLKREAFIAKMMSQQAPVLESAAAGTPVTRQSVIKAGSETKPLPSTPVKESVTQPAQPLPSTPVEEAVTPSALPLPSTPEAPPVAQPSVTQAQAQPAETPQPSLQMEQTVTQQHIEPPSTGEIPLSSIKEPPSEIPNAPENVPPDIEHVAALSLPKRESIKKETPGAITPAQALQIKLQQRREGITGATSAGKKEEPIQYYKNIVKDLKNLLSEKWDQFLSVFGTNNEIKAKDLTIPQKQDFPVYLDILLTYTELKKHKDDFTQEEWSNILKHVNLSAFEQDPVQFFKDNSAQLVTIQKNIKELVQLLNTWQTQIESYKTYFQNYFAQPFIIHESDIKKFLYNTFHTSLEELGKIQDAQTRFLNQLTEFQKILIENSSQAATKGELSSAINQLKLPEIPTKKEVTAAEEEPWEGEDNRTKPVAKTQEQPVVAGLARKPSTPGKITKTHGEEKATLEKFLSKRNLQHPQPIKKAAGMTLPSFNLALEKNKPNDFSHMKRQMPTSFEDLQKSNKGFFTWLQNLLRPVKNE
jgi:hypothetical protein